MDKRALIWQDGPLVSDTPPLVESMAAGISLAEGWRCIRRNAGYFNAANHERDVDLAVVCKYRGKWVPIVETHHRHGKPVILLELGYLRRGTTCLKVAPGYFQASLNRLCWLPPDDCPSDRFEALGMPLAPERKRQKKTGDILILGQVPDDGQHLLDEAALSAWYVAAVEKIRQHTDRKIVFRPHPKIAHRNLCPNADEMQTGVPLEEALAAAHACVTYNSTAGTEALLAAVPVVCSPAAMYAPWAETDFAAIEKPAVGDREQYFARLAYAQWTHEELRSGDAFRFLLRYLEAK